MIRIGPTAAILALALAATLGACGKKPSFPDAPQGADKDRFPQTYPAPPPGPDQKRFPFP